MKISITNILNRRKKFNAMLLVSALCLSTFLLLIATTGNPGDSKAIANPDLTNCTGTSNPDIYRCNIASNKTNEELSVYEGMDLNISGATTTVTSTGHHNFNNVTINAATVKTSSMTDVSTTDPNSGTMLMQETFLIDWTVNELTLINNGKINVNYQGYLGGRSTQSDYNYSGLGRGEHTYTTTSPTGCAGGGGGLGGDGQMGKYGATNDGAGGVYPVPSADRIGVFNRGSGGGHAHCPLNANGQPGGGAIHIHATKIIQSSGSTISANGSNVDSANLVVQKGGAGSGGTIWLEADMFSSGYYANATNGPVVSGGAGAGVGVTNGNAKIYAGISAKGGAGYGAYGGAGGGGIVKLNFGATKNFCYINVTGIIPATCENQDVILDGNGEPDTVTITTSGTHHYTSMIIMNDAVLTHEAIAVSEINTGAPPTNINYLDPTARDKKVDLTVDGDLTLDGGSIDVSGKGYPGGVIGSASINGYGPGGGQGDDTGSEHSGGAGGSFAGKGGHGAHEKLSGPIYDYNAFLPTGQIQVGSGGGAARAIDRGTADTSFCIDYGGGGGGRIKIVASKISVLNGGFMAANGQDGDSTGRSGCESPSGGGSGGAIVLNFHQFQISNSGYEPTVLGGSYTNIGEDGEVVSGVDVYNLEANGGVYDLRKHDVYGGSGAGGWIVINPAPPSVSVKKTLFPMKRGSSPDCVMATGVNCFNPYALQKGDKIKVQIWTTNVISSTTVSDEILSFPNNLKCSPDAGDVISGEGDVSGDRKKVVWTEAPVGGMIDVSYTCTIK